LAKGSTTIDRRGAGAGSVTDGAVCVTSEAAPTGAGRVGENLAAGQNHQETTAMTSAAPIAIGITAAPVTRCRGAGARTPVAGNSASTSGRISSKLSLTTARPP
jgi:hypothetical protein